LEQLLKGRTKLCGLQLVQLLRAVHQASLDQGEWKTAWMLTHLPDPVERPRFGGEPQDLEVIASYVKAMSDLERKSKGANPNPGGGKESEDGEGKGKKGKNKKKQGSDNMEG